MWWLIFTVVVLVSWSMTMALDGFFHSKKTRESFTLGVDSCIASAAKDVGFTVAESFPPYDVGMPKFNYVRTDRPYALEEYFNPSRDQNYKQTFGSACKYCGPLPASEACKTRLEKMDTDDEKEYELQTAICLASTFPASSTCVTHPKLRFDTGDLSTYYGYSNNSNNAVFNIYSENNLISESLGVYRDKESWIPCEHRTRKECADSVEVTIIQGDSTNETIRECVATFHDNVGDQEHIISTPNYLVDKVEKSIDTVTCRYAGEINNTAQCEGYYELNDDMIFTAQLNGMADTVDSEWSTEKSTYAKVFESDAFMIESNSKLSTKTDMSIEDLELAAAFAAEYVLLNDIRRGKTEIYDNLPSSCFSTSLGNSHLYSTPAGALYLSFGILLVLAHLAWLGSAYVDNHSMRFNSKRMMGLLGVTLSMLGLYLLFFVYGSSAGDIYNDDEARKLGNDIAFSDWTVLKDVSFVSRLEHGQMMMHNDGYTSTSTIQALEGKPSFCIILSPNHPLLTPGAVLHFVMLALAVGVPMFHPDNETGKGEVTWFA